MSARPSDIPESVWEAAREASDAVLVASGSGLRHYSFQSTIEAIITASARAILAAEKRGEERMRERCALIAENFVEPDGFDGDPKDACAHLIRQVPTTNEGE